MVFKETSLQLGFVKINQIDMGSRFSIGPNEQVRKFNSSKKSQTFGQQYADHVVQILPLNLMDDRDGSDSAVFIRS